MGDGHLAAGGAAVRFAGVARILVRLLPLLLPSYRPARQGALALVVASLFVQLSLGALAGSLLAFSSLPPGHVILLWAGLHASLGLAFSNAQGGQRSRQAGALVAGVALIVSLAPAWAGLGCCSWGRTGEGEGLWYGAFPRAEAIERGDLVVVRCANLAATGLARTVALPGETYWRRQKQVCFESGCFASVELSPTHDAGSAAALMLVGERFVVVESTPPMDSVPLEPTSPHLLGPAQYGIVPHSSNGCELPPIVGDELIGKVRWSGKSLLRLSPPQ